MLELPGRELVRAVCLGTRINCTASAMCPRRARNASAMLPQRFHENADGGKWTSPFARNMLEIPGPHFELIVGCKNSLQYGGAIYVWQGATCNIDGGTFVSNTASYVSRAAKDLESCRADLLYPCFPF